MTKRLLICVVCLLVAIASGAQQFGFIHHSIEDGLAQSQVRAIEQDSRGFLWFATMGGVSRFDGSQFVNYAASDGLVDNQVNCIFEGSDEGLWFGCAGGISVYNGTRFFPYPLPKPWQNNMVLSIVEEAPGKLLIATNGGGLLRFNTATVSYEQVEEFTTDPFIRILVRTPSNDLLVGGRSGLYRSPNFQLGELETLLDGVSISDVVLGDGDLVWAASFGSGVFRLESNTVQNITEVEGLQNNFVREIVRDRDGNLWVASRSGLNKLTSDGQPKFTTNIGLNYENIKTLFLDREENLWIGTDGKGVFRFTGERFVTFSKRDSLVSDIVMSIQRDKNNDLWLGSYDNGACRMGAEGVRGYSTDDGLLHNTIWSLQVDKQGYIWFGTNVGISRYDGRSFSNYTGPAADTFFDRVTAVREDSKGRMWFGVVNGIALYENGRFVSDSRTIDFPGRRVRNIFERSDGSMWFGTENGLVAAEDDGFKLYALPDDPRNQVVYSIAEDNQEQLWVGSKRGLFALQGDSLVQVVFSTGFGSNNINFLAHKLGLLYIGTNNGLFVMDTRSYHANGEIKTEHFTDQEGLPSLECNQNAVFLDDDGSLWFGTTEGVIRYNATENPFDAVPHEPLVLINSVKLVLDERNWEEIAATMDPRTGLPIGLELDPSNNHLTFEFVGLYFSNPSKVEFQYMLEGIDETWLPATSTNYTTYASLPHGTYRFKVRGRIAGNDWTETYDSFAFTILTPFYLTWWFILLVVIAVILLVAAIVAALFRQEARKRITQQLEYTSRMLALEQQALNSSMNRHFIFNALNSIQYYINRQDRLSANKYLSSFAKLIRKNLDSSQSNFTTLADELERINLYLSLENMRFPDKFEYHLQVDSSIDTHQVKIPAMLFQPYLENSIWHGILPKKEKGNLELSVRKQGEDVIIRITDDGIGIEKSREMRASAESQHIPQGMLINRNRIDLFRKMTDQNFSIDGPQDRIGADGITVGTVVEITFPLKSVIENGVGT